MTEKKCNQKGCDAPASYRFTWPGNDEAFICEGHVAKLRGIANAMGMYLQVAALDLAEKEGNDG